MKQLKGVLVIAVVIGTIVVFTGISFSQQRDSVKTLQNAATALQKSNPELSKGLNDLVKEVSDQRAKHEARLKLLQDSSVALKQSNPELSKELTRMTQSITKGRPTRGR